MRHRPISRWGPRSHIHRGWLPCRRPSTRRPWESLRRVEVFDEAPLLTFLRDRAVWRIQAHGGRASDLPRMHRTQRTFLQTIHFVCPLNRLERNYFQDGVGFWEKARATISVWGLKATSSVDALVTRRGPPDFNRREEARIQTGGPSDLAGSCHFTFPARKLRSALSASGQVSRLY